MAMKPRKKKAPAKKMRAGGMVKKMRGGVKAPVKKMRMGGMAKTQPMKKGGTDLATLRKMAKDKGYKLVKS